MGNLTINGVTYAKGLGTHAAADIRYTVPSNCTLSAQVGIDDEVSSTAATVAFEVWDGTTDRVSYGSPVKRAADAATAVSVPLGGVTNLRLVVDAAGDGISYDHADWGDAKIICGSGGGGDTTAPVLSSIASAPSATGATVTWITDEPADSQVEYGTTTAYGSSTPLDTTKVTSHGQILSGLVPETTYHYRVRSTDAAGNTATSTDRTFTTPGSSGQTTTFLSDMSPSAAPVNGWGPVESDQSIGESGAGDGGTLTINGVAYAKGLGTHAAADIRYTVPSNCTLSAQVSIDDEVLVDGCDDCVRGVGWHDDAFVRVAGEAGGGRGYCGVGPARWGDRSASGRRCGRGRHQLRPRRLGRRQDRLRVRQRSGAHDLLVPRRARTFRVGDVVQLSGSATDAAGQPIPDTGLSWQIVLQHCPERRLPPAPIRHVHGAHRIVRCARPWRRQPPRGFKLTATDSAGRTATLTRNMQPQTVSVTLDTTPTGLQVIYGGKVLTAPVTVQAIVGGTRTIEAPSPQGSATWQSWSDGGAQQHAITVPATSATFSTVFTGSSGQTTTFLSDMSPSAAPVNGWGPVESDQSIGESGAGDGGTLTINGVTYAKGLGTHAAADIRYTVPSNCTLSAQVGIDDEVSSTAATVAFEVWDGTTTRLYGSPVKRAADAATAVSVPLGGVTNLRLVVDAAGDGISYDHADWGDAKIICAPPG